MLKFDIILDLMPSEDLSYGYEGNEYETIRQIRFCRLWLRTMPEIPYPEVLRENS